MNRDTDRLDPAFDPRIADWLEADPDTAPRETLDAILAALPSIQQRRVFRVPWRFLRMFTPARAALAAVIGVALVGGALFLSQRPGQPSVGTPTEPQPTIPATPPFGLAIVELDGSVRRELGLPIDAWMADLSSDGTRIVFLTSDVGLGSCAPCDQPRYATVVAVGASVGGFIHPEPERLPPGAVEQPVLSPDGSMIAFTAADASGNVDIYVADIPESRGASTITAPYRRLTRDPAIDEFPAWTPDGTTILYDNEGSTSLDDSGLSPTQEIWSVSVEGGTPVRLTDNNVPDSQPDVAANGTVVFRRDNEIHTMALDGADQLRLDTAPSGFAPRWSPDGTRLAMLRYDPSARATMPEELGHGTNLPLLDVVVVDVTTGDVTFVGARVATDLNPVSWTPDGEALLINRYDLR